MSKDNYPLFNIDITLEDWEGPFKLFSDFLRISKLAEALNPLYGRSHVCKNGEIKGGFVAGLHIFKGSIGLDEVVSNHIHYENGRMAYFNKVEKKFFTEKFGEEPVYTLEGLYSKIKNNKINSKISSLCQQFSYHTSFNAKEFLENSLSKNKKTRLKFLEQKYRDLILNS